MSPQVQAGAAALTITRPLGVSMAGSYGDARAKSVLDDVSVGALVLDDGATAVAIVALDVCAIDPAVAERARERAESLSGIPAERAMLTCTHTHWGPATYSTPWYDADAGYLDVLARRIGEAVALAHRRRRDAQLLVGHGHEDSLSFNRRYWMRDGTLRTNPPFQSPEIVRPAGPIDPEVGVVRVEATEGQLIALLVNFALHVAVVGGRSISADYPGVLSHIVRTLERPEAVVLFALGCCGDIDHWDMSKPGPQSGQAVANRIGTALAGEVLKVNARPAPLDLWFGRTVVDLPLRVPTTEEIAWAWERWPFEMHSIDATGLQAVAAHRMWWVHGQGRTSTSAEVQVLALGDLAYVMLPAEIFVELGLAIKQHSPFPHTLIGTLNGSAIDYYIPTQKAYAEGGYEATNSPVMPGSGERVVETALDLLTVACYEHNAIS